MIGAEGSRLRAVVEYPVDEGGLDSLAGRVMLLGVCLSRALATSHHALSWSEQLVAVGAVFGVDMQPAKIIRRDALEKVRARG